MSKLILVLRTLMRKKIPLTVNCSWSAWKVKRENSMVKINVICSFM
jgi:hypothetical protein